MSIVPGYDPKQYIRVLKMATKPSRNELKMTSAVAGVGLALVGLLGFIIYWVMDFLPM